MREQVLSSICDHLCWRPIKLSNLCPNEDRTIQIFVPISCLARILQLSKIHPTNFVLINTFLQDVFKGINMNVPLCIMRVVKSYNEKKIAVYTTRDMV